MAAKIYDANLKEQIIQNRQIRGGGEDKMGNGFIISKETWDHMPEEQQKWIMFETMQVVNARLKRLERWNKAFSFGGGVIGGIAGALGIKIGGQG